MRSGNGVTVCTRCARDGQVVRRGDWIQGAVRNQGALHRALGIPESKPIPRSKLEEAKHSKDPHLRRMAHLAETLRGLNHGSRSAKRGKS